MLYEGKHLRADDHSPLVFSGTFDRNFDVALALEARELLSPLDQQNMIVAHQIVEAECFKLTLRVYAIEIDVVEGGLRPTIFVDERKGWTSDVVF